MTPPPEPFATLRWLPGSTDPTLKRPTVAQFTQVKHAMSDNPTTTDSNGTSFPDLEGGATPPAGNGGWVESDDPLGEEIEEEATDRLKRNTFLKLGDGDSCQIAFTRFKSRENDDQWNAKDRTWEPYDPNRHEKHSWRYERQVAVFEATIGGSTVSFDPPLIKVLTGPPTLKYNTIEAIRDIGKDRLSRALVEVRRKGAAADTKFSYLPLRQLTDAEVAMVRAMPPAIPEERDD